MLPSSASTSNGVYTEMEPAALRTWKTAAESNKQPILELLQRYIQASSQCLQAMTVAEGSGQHVSYFATAYPGIQFQPSDMTSEMFGSIEAHSEGLPNVKPPILLDPSQQAWPVPKNLDILIAINFTHITPWDATLSLMSGAARHLAPGGRLFIYGPFKKDGQYTSESGGAYDQTLRMRNELWGLRDIEHVMEAAHAQGFYTDGVHDMPANNVMMAFTWVGKHDC